MGGFPSRDTKLISWFQALLAPSATSEIVKEIGHRQVYDILQGRKPRATGGELWGFRVWPGREACATAVGVGASGRQQGRQGRCSASTLP